MQSNQSNTFTYEHIMDMLGKLVVSMQETDQQIKQLKDYFQETDNKIKQTDKQIQMLLESIKAHDNFITNYSQTIEFMFYSYFEKEIDRKGYVEINGFKFYKVYKNVRIGQKRKNKEVDILLTNRPEKILAIIEVKSTIHDRDIDRMEKVREYLPLDPDYGDFNAIFGFGSTNIHEEQIEYLLSKGYFVVRYILDKNNIQTIVPQNFEIFTP